MRIKIISQFILTLLFLFLWLTAVCLIFEIYLRVKGEFTAKQFLIGESGWNRDVEKYKSTDLVPSSDAGLGWELKPKKDLLNAYGRFKKGRHPKPKGVLRIIAIGDSITQQGFYERFLDDRLNSMNLGCRFEVWNCGTSGYNLGNYYYYLKRKALNFNPDLIILGFCLNDFSANNLTLFNEGKYYDFHDPFAVIDFPFSQYLFLHSNLYRFVLFRLEKAKLRRTDIDAILNRQLDSMIDICSKRKIKIIALIWPYLKDVYNDADTGEYRRVKTALENKRIPFIDLHDVLTDRSDLTLRLNSYDYIHPSEKTFGIMVDKGICPFVTSYLKNSGLLHKR